MHTLDVLLQITFGVGLILSGSFCYLYATRSAWTETEAGRAIMALISILTLIYASNLATSLWPAFFHAVPGLAVRLAVRVLAVGVLANLCRVLLRTQHHDADDADHPDDLEGAR